jgi:hypothetical protein
MSIVGNPPSPNCGEMSPLTEAVRPFVQLTKEQCVVARRLRRTGYEVEAIAANLSVSVEAVLQALAPMRMHNPAASRATLNVTLATHDFVMHQRLGNEPVWSTTGRLLTELVMLRAEVIVLRARRP